MAAENANVAVVIVNWNSGPALARCLAALRQQDLPPRRVVVVENGSSDGSDAVLHGAQGVETVRGQGNVGFSAGNNLGIGLCSDCEWIATLNADAFPRRDWLSRLVDRAQRDPAYSFFASRMLMANDPSRLDGAGDFYHVSGWAARRGHGGPAATTALESEEVFSACAAAAMYRRSALLQVGGFDEDYFCYFEDVDLGFRLRLHGHRCLYVADAVVEHIGSLTVGRHSPFAVYHGHRNLVWTYFRNMPADLLWLYLPQHLAFNAVSLVRFAAKGLAGPFLRAKRDALRGLPRVVKGRPHARHPQITDAQLKQQLSRGLLLPYRVGASQARAARSARAARPS